MIEKIMKTCGWLMWVSIMALGYGFGWKTAWEMMMVNWNFAAWNSFDWVMFVGGLVLAHAAFALLVTLGPIGIKRYVTVKAKKDI
jgi:hypothetical protein